MSSQTYDDLPETTGWIGWGIFAATIMIIAVTLNAIYGLVAVVNDDRVLPVYPLWSLVVITLDVLVTWALTAHGRELRTH